MIKIVYSTIILIFFLLTVSVNARLELILENGFQVPDLNKPIMQIKINDLQSGDLPEILATDGETVVLYSPALDFNLFTKSLDWEGADRYFFKIEFADINRDSIPDIVIGTLREESGSNTALLECFDGTNLDSLGTYRKYFQTIEKNISFGLTNLQVLDINNDGFNELLFAFDEIWAEAIHYQEHTIGRTRCYYSFPDSILWNITLPTGRAVPLCHDENRGFYHTYGYNVDYGSIGGTDWRRKKCWTFIIESDGSHSSMVFALGEASDTISLGNSYGSITGDFGFGSTINDALIIHDSKNVPGHSRSLCMYNVNSTDFIDLNWHLTALDIDNLIEHPSFDGHCLVKIDNHISLIRFSDGAVIEESADLPPGKISWTYPYPDGIPRLAITDSNTVTLYNLDIATDANQPTAGQSLPQKFSLAQNYPNPFNPSTEIAFDLPQKSFVSIDIYNLLGRKVTNLINNELPAGTHRVFWNGRDQVGLEVATGIYFYRLTAADFTETKKMLLLK